MKTDLGLERGKVELSAPNREWSEMFAREHGLLSETLGALARAIEHVGSTAVDATPAKPIIDIAVAVDSLDTVPEIITRLERRGYRYRGDGAFTGGHLFIRESTPGVRTHHVHVVAADDPQWQSWLRFRHFLRTDRELRHRYIRLKRELSARFPSDRRSYTLAKSRFIESILSHDT